MIVGLVIVVVLAAALIAFLATRQRPPSTPPAATRARLGAAPPAATVPASGPAVVRQAAADRPRAAAATLTEALWRRAFDATGPSDGLPAEHGVVRDAVLVTLEGESLGGSHFPRRPMLMPQLLHAVNDPDAGPATLAAIVAQDPVLTGDVLRLANSAFYRVAPDPVESIQRAIVVCGSDGLQSLVATALVQPVFRGAQAVFARFPATLWQRTSLAAQAAELYAIETRSADRLLAQLAVLLGALGPLVIYRATIDAYRKVPALRPHPELFLGLIGAHGASMSRRIALQWELPPRVITALEVEAGAAPSPDAAGLTESISWGGLLGTLAALERDGAITADGSAELATGAGLSPELQAAIQSRLRAA